MNDPIHAAQLHITNGLVYLDVPGEREHFTVPFEHGWRDGQWVRRNAESVLGGRRRNIKFRFMR